jgi:hypothetical protein
VADSPVGEKPKRDADEQFHYHLYQIPSLRDVQLSLNSLKGSFHIWSLL